MEDIRQKSARPHLCEHLCRKGRAMLLGQPLQLPGGSGTTEALQAVRVHACRRNRGLEPRREDLYHLYLSLIYIYYSIRYFTILYYTILYYIILYYIYYIYYIIYFYIISKRRKGTRQDSLCNGEGTGSLERLFQGRDGCNIHSRHSS